MLEQFHLLTLQGKLTAYDYYQSLVKLTDNTGLTTSYICTHNDMRQTLLTTTIRIA